MQEQSEGKSLRGWQKSQSRGTNHGSDVPFITLATLPCSASSHPSHPHPRGRCHTMPADGVLGVLSASARHRALWWASSEMRPQPPSVSGTHCPPRPASLWKLSSNRQNASTLMHIDL